MEKELEKKEDIFSFEDACNIKIEKKEIAGKTIYIKPLTQEVRQRCLEASKVPNMDGKDQYDANIYNSLVIANSIVKQNGDKYYEDKEAIIKLKNIKVGTLDILLDLINEVSGIPTNDLKLKLLKEVIKKN